MGSSESIPFSQIVSEISGVSQCPYFSGINVSSIHVLNENRVFLSQLSYQSRSYPIGYASEPFIPGSFQFKFSQQIGNMKMDITSEPSISLDLPLSQNLGTSLLLSRDPIPSLNLSLSKIGKICSDFSLNLSYENKMIDASIVSNATIGLMNNLFVGGLLSHSIRQPNENGFQGTVLARFGLISTGIFLTTKKYEFSSSFGFNLPIFITKKKALEFGFSSVYLHDLKSNLKLLNLFSGTKYYISNKYEIQSGISFGNELRISSLFSCSLKPNIILKLNGSYNLLDRGLNVGLNLNLINSSIEMSK